MVGILEGADPKTKDKTSDRNSVYITGDDKRSSHPRAISEQTNAETTRLRFDYTYNDLNHPSKAYFRSDSYSYAKLGLPVISYFAGWHSNYHKPTDDPDRLDFEKMERTSRLAFVTSWRVANLDRRLPLDR